MDDLILLAPGFADPAHPGRTFVCPDCTLIEGLLAVTPGLAGKLNVRRVPFPRPRQAVIDLIGEENQSLPALILAEGVSSPFARVSARGRAFIAEPRAIAAELHRRFGAPELHP